MTDPQELVFMALGSNLGDRESNLGIGRSVLAGLANTTVVATSIVEETSSLGPQPQHDYLNQMLLLLTERAPHELLEAAHAAEQRAGRIRAERWGPRTLDVDIVRFGNSVIEDPGLTVPHPELVNRPFWLREVGELLENADGTGVPEWALIKPRRRAHIQRVAGLMDTWAITMGKAPEERARWVRAAFLHDALRDAPQKDLNRGAPGWTDQPGLCHGPAAAGVAQEHGETDEGILAAVRYHSVGYAGWDEVGRMLYLADYLDPDRAFKRRQRAELCVQVPKEPQRVLALVASKRLRWAVKRGLQIRPEAWDFWNDIARYC